MKIFLKNLYNHPLRDITIWNKMYDNEEVNFKSSRKLNSAALVCRFLRTIYRIYTHALARHTGALVTCKHVPNFAGKAW